MQQSKKNKKENADTLRKNFEDKLPKNVRQIGNVSQGTKIYIEDYVLNYLKRVQKENQTQEKDFAVVLVGEKHVSLKTTYYFVVGAVALNVDVRKESKAMPESVRKQLERTIETYFGKENSALCQLGWGSKLIVADKIPSEYEVFHRENFGSGNMIFLGLNEDFEEVFYISENGKLKKQSGYYIYFDRNEGMQQYVQDNQPAQSVEAELVTKSNSEQYKVLLANHKEEIQKKRIITFLYSASTFLVMVVIVLGVTLINHYDKLKEMQDVISSLSRSVLDDSNNSEISGEALQNVSSKSALGIDENETLNDNSEETFNNNGTGEALQKDVSGNAAEISEGTSGSSSIEGNANEASQNNVSGNAAEISQNNTSNDSSEKDVSENSESVESSATQYEDFLSEEFRCYEIKDGDTLSGICKKLYGSLEYFDKICEYNHIENTDEIKAGQKIWVP